MRGIFRDYSNYRHWRLLGMAGATFDRIERKRLLYRSDLWGLREKFFAGLATWPEHRDAVRALKRRRFRSRQERTFTQVSIRRAATGIASAVGVSRGADDEWPHRRSPTSFHVPRIGEMAVYGGHDDRLGG